MSKKRKKGSTGGFKYPWGGKRAPRGGKFWVREDPPPLIEIGVLGKGKPRTGEREGFGGKREGVFFFNARTAGGGE